ncbi:hypothetical protein A0J61_05402 [Choanephora cucurbitarum]|uniref:Uncharacterized protein n=1 Tax=Choanephora cucurbitarum TaxID=101091 RepID=A0A1C7NBS5_9FUNG|nr:hypothetical protein A0J61_05402 [Choanephora cucurbitarum]
MMPQRIEKKMKDDKMAQQFIRKLDEGTQTIMNLRSLLTCKSAELNELVQQLEWIDQVLTRLENGTEYMEMMLQESCSTDKLLNAEATLDSAIQSASQLYLVDHQQALAQRNKWTTKIDRLLKELGLDCERDRFVHGDVDVLQKTFQNLELATTIATSIKTNLKHRQQWIKKKSPSQDRIKQIENEIRRQVVSYKMYTRNAPLYIQQDIHTVFDLEDKPTLPTKKIKQQQQQKLKKSSQTIQSSHLSSHTVSRKSTKLQSIARPTLTFLAKQKAIMTSTSTTTVHGPGSTLRFRSMLARRHVPPQPISVM